MVLKIMNPDFDNWFSKYERFAATDICGGNDIEK